MDDEIPEDDIYREDYRDDLIENDCISAEEEGFMQGYDGDNDDKEDDTEEE